MFDKLRRILRSRAATWCAVGVTLLVFTGGPATAALVQYWTLDSDGANAVTGGNTATIINAAGTEFTSDAPSALAYSTGSVLLTNPAAAPLNQWINLGKINQKCGNAIFADDPTLTTHGLTVSFWFKANSFNTDMRLFGPTIGDASPTTARVATDPATAPDTAQMQVVAGGAWAAMTPAASLQREQWHHVAFSWTGTVVAVYLDGVAGGGGIGALANYDLEEVGIGHRFRDLYGQHFDGYIDDVAIWDKALMPATIAQLAAGTVPTEIDEANAFPFPEYSQVVNIDIDGFRWYPRTDEQGNPIDPEQVFYPDYAGTGVLQGIGNTWNKVLPTVVASDGKPFGDSEVELIGALDAGGTATEINFYASGFEFGWCAPRERNADHLIGEGLVGYPKNTNEWQIDGLTVGETYDLIFYGNGGNTVNITSGADLQSIHWSASNRLLLVLGEDPSDLLEDQHFVRVTITPDSSTVTGTFRPDDAGGMRFSGLQIALHGSGVEPLPGDLNGDGMVGSGDLDIVRGNWGQSVDPGCLSCGDPSGDGAVGSADLDIVRANWGQTAAAAVPEPGMSFLLVIGGILLMVRTRWNRTAVLLAVVTAIVIAPSGAFAEIVQYWKLDETDWSYTAANAIVTGNTGFLNAFMGDEWSEDVPAALSYSTGSLEFKKAYMQNVTLGDLNLSNLPDTGNAPGVTMSMWIKPTTLVDDTRLFGTPAGVTNPNPSHIRLNGDGSAMVWAPSAWYTIASPGTIQTGQWQNLVATWSNSGMTLFVDGKPVGACGPAIFPYTGGEAGISVPFLGAYGFHFDGLVDDLVLWNETLPPSAVKQLAAGTAPEDVSAEFVLPTYSQIVNVDFKFGDLDAYAGKGVIEQAGTTWNEPVISGARNAAGCAATNLVDSQGAATTIDVICTGFEFGYEPGEGVNVVNHPFTGDRLVAKTTSDNVFEIGGLEVGATYDLFFYGHNQGTIDITAGAAAVSGEFVAENYTGVFSMIDDAPEDWIFVEDINYVRLTITPTAATVTGEFNPSEAVSPRMSWCGLQIAKLAPAAVPEPTSLVLLLGAAALLIMRRK